MKQHLKGLFCTAAWIDRAQGLAAEESHGYDVISLIPPSAFS